tara:strand:- start:893 stop:1420 length:528 start_codon:yes stop_codon:yes gene_type:complete
MALTQVRPAGLIFPTDSVLQVKSATQTDIASFSSSSTSNFVDLSGLSVSITPESTSNKILVMFNVNVAQSVAATVHVRLVRDSTAIYIGDAEGSNRIRSSALSRTAATPYDFEIPNLSGTHLDSPSSTSAVTYKLQGTLGSTYSGTFYVNRMKTDGDSDFQGRTASSITVMEIVG